MKKVLLLSQTKFEPKRGSEPCAEFGDQVARRCLTILTLHRQKIYPSTQ